MAIYFRYCTLFYLSYCGAPRLLAWQYCTQLPNEVGPERHAAAGSLRSHIQYIPFRRFRMPPNTRIMPRRAPKSFDSQRGIISESTSCSEANALCSGEAPAYPARVLYHGSFRVMRWSVTRNDGFLRAPPIVQRGDATV